MAEREEDSVRAFNEDALSNEGYLYTTQARLSSVLANRKLTEAALSAIDMRGKRVLDIGCGDGTYTMELFDRAQPAFMCGVDLAAEAIRIAEGRKGKRGISFAVASIDSLPYEADSFDIVHIRGVLHHMDAPQGALRAALRVAPAIVVIEPNGYNPVLKVLERFSGYHLRHRERSYRPATIAHWVGLAGGEVRPGRYLGLVPFFCPDWMARTLKWAEPLIERLPLLNRLACAVYVFVAVRGKCAR